MDLNDGAIASDASALALGRVDRAIRLAQCFAIRFADTRTTRPVRQRVETSVAQRVGGIVRGYEGLNNHDKLRCDLSVGGPRQQAGGAAIGLCAAYRRIHAESAGPSGAEPIRHHKVSHDAAVIGHRFVDLFFEARTTAPKRIILERGVADYSLRGKHEGRFCPGYDDCRCYPPLHIFCGRRPAAGGR